MLYRLIVPKKLNTVVKKKGTIPNFSGMSATPARKGRYSHRRESERRIMPMAFARVGGSPVFYFVYWHMHWRMFLTLYLLMDQATNYRAYLGGTLGLTLQKRGTLMDTIALEQKRKDGILTDATIREVVAAIVEHFDPEKIILFGSYAGGRPNPDSDLDLLVVMESSEPRHHRAAPIRLLFRPAPCSMDILVYTPEEIAYWNGTVNHIITEAMNTGRTVYVRAS